jgi:hypothetical protein
MMKRTLTTEPLAEKRTNSPRTWDNAQTDGINEPADSIEDGLNIGRQLGIGLAMVIFLTLLTGIIYPLAVTGIAQAVFSSQANGSIVANKQGQPVGSSLIGQVFTDTRYFYGRPSAGGLFNTNAGDPNADTVYQVVQTLVQRAPGWC